MAENSRQEIDQQVRRAKSRLASADAQLRRIPGVRAVSVGIKEVGGHATGNVAFHVYVEEKRPLHQLPVEHRIPAVVAGIPTDVIGCDSMEPLAVLMGGQEIIEGTWCQESGTAGAFALATAANTHVPQDTPLLVTNQHVVSHIGRAVGRSIWLCDCWCCACCDIGTVVDAQLTRDVDGAIVTLNDGVRFSHELLGIGAIRGTGVATHDMHIVKFGNRTGLTRGTVTDPNVPVFPRSDGATFDNQIRVAPNAAFPKMVDKGDSGSVFVDADTNRIVGLVHAHSGVAGIGNHIAAVVALLHIDFPIIGTAHGLPLSGTIEEPVAPTMLDTVAALQDEFGRTEVGQRWIALVRFHAEEIRHLVNHHRQTQVAWHRSRGPAFLAHYAKSAREPQYRVPREIGGMRIENTIVSMAAVLQRYGSQELAKAITDYYLTALELAQQSQSAQDLVSRARLIAGVDRPAVTPQG